MKLLLAGIALLSIVRPALADEPFPLPRADWPPPVDDHRVIPFLLVDRLEYRMQQGTDAAGWDAQGWIGGDYNKLWLKTEGEFLTSPRAERADVQAYYARLISPFWYVEAGASAEIRPSPSRGALALALQGLAPYWFDVEASLFLNQKGKLAGRLELEYDLLFTQRLILQPRFETNVAANSDEERGIGRWFNDVELGLRLRYEFHRQFAPYIGGNWTRKLGGTADLARQAQSEVSEASIVAGLRILL